MQIGEIVAPPVPHSTPNEDCPFCPPPDDKKFTTYAGAEKSESRLKSIMADPSKLASLESNARPKLGEADQQNASSARNYPSSPLVHPEARFGVYSYEAHHLIPGTEKVAPGSTKQVMSGHAIEKWIKAGDNIDRDSGYSINNSDNGVWLPSAPIANKKNPGNPTPALPWSSEVKTVKRVAQGLPTVTSDEKHEIANFAMLRGAGQFHYGQHKVLNEEGTHYTYSKEVVSRLDQLEKGIAAWAPVCFCEKKEPKPPFKPTWQINQKMDGVSRWIEIDIKQMPPANWEFWISTLAKELTELLTGGV